VSLLTKFENTVYVTHRKSRNESFMSILTRLYSLITQPAADESESLNV